MSIRRLRNKSARRRAQGLPLAALFSISVGGCAAPLEGEEEDALAEPESVATAEQALLTVPYRAPAVQGALPYLPNTGAALPDRSAWKDLENPPVGFTPAWILSASGNAHAAPPNFSARLRSAADDARQEADARSSEVGNTIRTALGWLPYIDSIENPVVRAIGYTPERMRWTTHAFGTPVAQPPGAAEFAGRAERIFCTAKTARRHTTSSHRIMGEKSLVDFKLVGKHLRMLTFEPTLSMQNPRRYDSNTNDGAAGFVIPYTAGVRVTPLKFLPSLPELRVPVDHFMADGAVAFARVGANGAAIDNFRAHTHVDGFASSKQSATVSSGDIDLFSIGPVMISAKLKLEMGFSSCSYGDGYDNCAASSIGQVPRGLARWTEPNGTRLPLVPPARAGGWTTGASTPGMTNDAAYNVSVFAANQFSPRRAPIFIPGDSATQPELYTTPWLGSRPFQNNDKSFELQSRLGATLTLAAKAGIDRPRYKLNVKAEGYIGGGGTLIHSFRERLELERLATLNPGSELPTIRNALKTSFSVTPSTASDIEYGTEGSLNLSVKLSRFWVNWSLELWRAFDTDAKARTIWPEANRLRMDNAKEGPGGVTLDATSHWPGGSPFASNSSAECRSNDTVVDAPPPACTPRTHTRAADELSPTSGVPLCFYSRHARAADPDLPSSYAYARCMDEVARPFIMAGTHKTGQAWKGETVDARVLQTATFDAEMEAAIGVMQKCADFIGTAAGVQAQLGVAACDDRATLYEKVLEPTIDTSAPRAPSSSSAPCR
jgi:hypothetical protein